MIIYDIAGETLNTREEAARPGPYCDEMSVVLHQSDCEDESRGDFTIYGTGRRFGRRILWCDTQGFMCVDTYDTEDLASATLNDWADENDEGDEECEVLVEVDGPPSGESVGVCVCGRVIYWSHFAGTVYHAS